MKQQTALTELIEKLKHDLEYFTPPNNEFQAGRRNQSASLLTFAESLLSKEKQQIIEAYDRPLKKLEIMISDGHTIWDGEQYFKEVYEKD